jgi:ribosome biogenesis GTPase / thiamine phosphate phosphatase
MNIEKIEFPEKYLELAGENIKNIARIISQHGEIYKIRTKDFEMIARVSGKLEHNITHLSSFPVVGDYVIVKNTEQGEGVIHEVLLRKSLFIRKAAGTSKNEQAIAANIDYVFICMSLNNDFNLRRLERYLAISWDSGAVPVVVLTKADLCEDVDEKTSEVENIALGVSIITTSSLEDIGYDRLFEYVKKDKTVAFLGSSGVGKSTLINKLIGENIIKTKEIRGDDDKGRHTTTSRNLFYLKNGGAVIDTPGMREIGIESADISQTFSDIEELALLCKFSDCQHLSEPGCAVKKAAEDGIITNARVKSYNKLKIEMGYEGLNFKQLEKEKLNRMFADHGGIKNVKKVMKEKNKRN